MPNCPRCEEYRERAEAAERDRDSLLACADDRDKTERLIAAERERDVWHESANRFEKYKLAAERRVRELEELRDELQARLTQLGYDPQDADL